MSFRSRIDRLLYTVRRIAFRPRIRPGITWLPGERPTELPPDANELERLVHQTLHQMDHSILPE